MQWYYVKNGQRLGPVDDEAFQRLIAARAIAPGDLVWNETMGAEWQEAGRVPGLALPSGPTPTAGTGGLTPNAELTRRAREALASRWGIAVAFSVLYFALCIGISLVSNAIPSVGWIVQLLVEGPLTVGVMIFFLALAARGAADIAQMFDGFRRFGVSLGAYLLVALFSCLWLLAAMVPMGLVWAAVFGFRTAHSSRMLILPMALTLVVALVASILISLRYSQVLFVVAGDPLVGPRQAVRRGVAMMRGRYGKLFRLWLRFLGWMLLGMLPCFIGLLWATPYAMTGMACFYRDLQPAAAPASAGVEPAGGQPVERPEEPQDQGGVESGPTA